MTFESAEQLSPAIRRLLALCLPERWPVVPAAPELHSGARPMQHGPTTATDRPVHDTSAALPQPAEAAQLTMDAPPFGGPKRQCPSHQALSRDVKRVKSSAHAQGYSTHPPLHASPPPASRPPRAPPTAVAAHAQHAHAEAHASHGRQGAQGFADCTGFVRLLQVLQRLARRHCHFIEQLLPRMLAAQHGFVWPQIAPLATMLKADSAQAVRAEPERAQHGVLCGGIPLWRPDVHVQDGHVGKEVDVLQNDDVQLVAGACTALGMFVLVFNAANAEPALTRRLPQRWRALYNDVVRHCQLQGWHVQSALPAAWLTHVGTVCECWMKQARR